MKSLSRVQLFAIPWTVAYQASPSMGFSRQEYWSGLPFPSPDSELKHSENLTVLTSSQVTHHIVYELLTDTVLLLGPPLGNVYSASKALKEMYQSHTVHLSLKT